MKVKNNIQILDDNGKNINNKPCVFKYSYGIVCNKLDGMYGISGAERKKEDDYIEEKIAKTIGVFNEEENTITDLYGNKINLNKYKLIEVKILDIDKLI